MFDTVSGLPVHVLVVHAVVVLLPLMAIVTVAVAVVPRWRRAAPVAVAGDAVVLGLAWVATESGENLQARLQQLSGSPVAQEHADRGDLVPWFALALLVAAVLAWAGRRIAVLVPVSIVATVLAGAAAIGWVFLTGESGAEAVWSELIRNTRAP